MGAELNAKTQGRKDARDVGGLAPWRPGDFALPEGFRDTPLGPLPETWKVVRLQDVTEDTQQRDPSQESDKTFKYIDVSSVSNKTYQIQGWKAYKGCEAPSRARKVVLYRDVLFATVRPYLRNIAQVPSHLDGEICSTGFCVIRAKDGKSDADYLYYAVLSDSFVEKVVAQQRGSSYPAVSDKVILSERIPLPPLPEQRAIVHALRTVQEAREATERVIAAARELKCSLMRHLFTYGPVPIAQADRLELQETPFGSAPAHWRIAPLDKYAFVQTGAAKGRRFGDSSTITVPYLRVANVQDGYLNLSEIKYIEIREDELKRYSLQPGDVVVTEGGDFDKLGRGSIWHGEIQDCIHQNHIFAIRAERSTLLPEYLTYLIQSGYGKSYFLNVAHRTTHLACINTTKLRAFPTLIPSLAEQREIADILSTVDAKIAAEEARRGALEALFHTLLHHLMTGKVRAMALYG